MGLPYITLNVCSRLVQRKEPNTCFLHNRTLVSSFCSKMMVFKNKTVPCHSFCIYIFCFIQGALFLFLFLALPLRSIEAGFKPVLFKKPHNLVIGVIQNDI